MYTVYTYVYIYIQYIYIYTVYIYIQYIYIYSIYIYIQHHGQSGHLQHTDAYPTGLINAPESSKKLQDEAS